MALATNPTAQLCDWVCSTGYNDLPDDVRKAAVNIIYDCIGGMIASSTLPTCLPVVNMVKTMGGSGQCSIVGHPFKTTATYAALANGTIAHGDEVDAVSQHGSGHFAAVAVPAGMSLGQYVKGSGRELVRAIALGCETALRVNSVLAEALEFRRWHFQLATTGSPLGAAVAAGILLDLNVEQMEHALGLVTSHAGGLNSVFYDPTHDSKSLQCGIAAHAGVVAALLAREGFHGPLNTLTIEHGLFDSFTDHASVGKQVVAELGTTYQIRRVAFKRFPVGGPDQAPLFAFLQLMRDHRLSADDMDHVEVTLSPSAFWTVATTKHPSIHLPTILSLAAIFGEVTFPHIHQASYYQDPRVEAFIERIRQMPEPGSGGGGNRESRFQTRVRVRTRSGQVLTEELRNPLVDQTELQQKFRSLIGLRVNKERVLDLEKKIKGIEALDNVAPLIDELELRFEQSEG